MQKAKLKRQKEENTRHPSTPLGTGSDNRGTEKVDPRESAVGKKIEAAKAGSLQDVKELLDLVKQAS